ncbi:MAG TPA: class III extradiol ring-cleavage dioxygenase [Myxococcaceae bacterium]|jgi:4,5-DOPA dioxygenase extradiol
MSASTPPNPTDGARRLPALFVSHGAATLTLNPRTPVHSWLRSLGPELQRLGAKAIVCVSAHHQAAPHVRVGTSLTPETIHDHPAAEHHGFRWPVAGSPEVARRVLQALEAAGLRGEEAPTQGLDHGAWVPLSLLFPEARVPVVPLSLHASMARTLHLALGQALAPLRDEGVLLIGSGGTVHNLREFRRSFLGGEAQHEAPPWAHEFDTWVTETLTQQPAFQRNQALANFSSHPLASKAHPTPEHFLPLLVVAGSSAEGAPEQRPRRLHTSYQHGLAMSAFWFDV